MRLDDSNQLLLGLWLSSADVEMEGRAETFCGRNTQGCSLLLSIMRGQKIDSLQPDASLRGHAQLGSPEDSSRGQSLARTGMKALNKECDDSEPEEELGKALGGHW